jgi:hypothetical protein
VPSWSNFSDNVNAAMANPSDKYEIRNAKYETE